MTEQVIVIVAAYGILLSYLAVRDAAIVSRLPTSLFALALSVALAAWALRLAIEQYGYWLLTSIIFSCFVALTHGYFYATVISQVAVAIASGLTGVSGLKVAPTYDRADAAFKAGALDTAHQLYTEQTRRHRDDPSLWKRLAEVCERQGDLAQAAQHLGKAIVLVGEPEPKSLLVFRLADLLAHRLRQPDTARELLLQFISMCPDTPQAGYARERLERLAGPPASRK